MWELDYKESWAPKNWCFWTVVLEKTLESPLDCKEIKPVHPKEDQSWIVTGRTDAEAPILWPPDVKNWLIWKDPDAGKDWRQEEKWTTEDEIVGWHHLHDGHEFEQALGVGDGQGGLVCCNSWGHKESDTTEQLTTNTHAWYIKGQYFGHLMWRVNSLEKTLMLGKIEGRRRSGWQRTRWLDGISDSVGMSLSKLWKIVKDREAWHATVHGVTKSLTWLSNWTTTSHMPKLLSKGWFLLTTDLISEYTPGVGWEISNYPQLTP